MARSEGTGDKRVLEPVLILSRQVYMLLGAGAVNKTVQELHHQMIVTGPDSSAFEVLCIECKEHSQKLPLQKGLGIPSERLYQVQVLMRHYASIVLVSEPAA